MKNKLLTTIVSYNLQWLRLSMGYTTRRFSNILGIRPDALYQLESGRYNISLRAINKISEKLKISPIILMTHRPELTRDNLPDKVR